MKRILLAAALLLGIQERSIAQTAATAHSAGMAATSLESRISQYYADLQQRLREVYFAPSDGRAISLLSNLMTEFTARRKALIAEAQPAGRSGLKPTAAWMQEQQALLSSSNATKMAARRQQNLALDQAFKRFEAAQLPNLQPVAPPTEQ
ncbi:hypothetical protein [Hymenobacter cellulosivorans]|uniref:Uncharacterized protein n=1 Tax=Hymenobacter cellulosivorans TaxID=2932249 RepID=A0ABY4F8K8_9BACT|nr:hypothetical protein [Hymenobacter cellulosivorans]UOQ53003.1 hypothetical protein MUN80_25105 [Hymenobacter cellulosivorans]